MIRGDLSQALPWKEMVTVAVSLIGSIICSGALAFACMKKVQNDQWVYESGSNQLKGPDMNNPFIALMESVLKHIRRNKSDGNARAKDARDRAKEKRLKAHKKEENRLKKR